MARQGDRHARARSVLGHQHPGARGDRPHGNVGHRHRGRWRRRRRRPRRESRRVRPLRIRRGGLRDKLVSCVRSYDVHGCERDVEVDSRTCPFGCRTDSDSDPTCDHADACLSHCGGPCDGPEVCGANGRWGCECRLACDDIARAEDPHACCPTEPARPASRSGARASVRIAATLARRTRVRFGRRIALIGGRARSL